MTHVQIYTFICKTELQRLILVKPNYGKYFLVHASFVFHMKIIPEMPPELTDHETTKWNWQDKFHHGHAIFLSTEEKVTASKPAKLLVSW